jgi:hypothetical protein
MIQIYPIESFLNLKIEFENLPLVLKAGSFGSSNAEIFLSPKLRYLDQYKYPPKKLRSLGDFSTGTKGEFKE